MRHSILGSLFLLLAASLAVAAASAAPGPEVKIGNYLVDAPYGIAFIVDDATGFLINPVCDETSQKSRFAEDDPALTPPGTTAPDFSFSQVTCHHAGAAIKFTWGRSGPGAVVATLESDRKVAVLLRFPGTTWPRFHAVYMAREDGLDGYGIEQPTKFIPFAFHASPAPAFVRANITYYADVTLNLDPEKPTKFVAGVGQLPSLDSVEATLAAAQQRYFAHRISAQGDWGDFLSPIADNLNNVRLYANDNKRIVQAIGRGWWMGKNPDLSPYFVWDYMFNGLLSSLEDPASARDTVRGILSFQTPDGRVPSFAHWFNERGVYDTLHRSMPPVGFLAVWTMQQRHPDNAFLAEVYPRLVRWHDWWPKGRDGNHNGLLEWGSEQHYWQGAQYETGWDDNIPYHDTMLVGNTQNADAIDLSSLWAMDAEYLSRIATALGKTADAQRFKGDQAAMNKRINDRLWNEDLGIYCSRYWEPPPVESDPLNHEAVFKSGFDIRYFSDSGLLNEGGREHAKQLDFDWKDASPADKVPATGWSARITAEFTAPKSGAYRFKIGGSDYVRISINGKAVNDWMVDNRERRVVELKAEAGKSYPIAIDYFRNDEGLATLHLSVVSLSPGKPGSDWITRLTPMNFYPLTAGAADNVRAQKTLAWMYREDKFWLPWLLPTLAKDDPQWPEQEYWHGHVWAPANYIVWLGMKKYADEERRAEYARRGVALFMRNWTANRVDCETYKSTDGSCDDLPHYMWGALLDVIGLEALVDVGPDFEPVVSQNSAVKENITLRNVPFGGKLYRIEAKDGKVTAQPETSQ
jgi:hypothetical protein